MARPTLPAQIANLLKKQQFVPDTALPSYRLLDILAMADGDVSSLVARFREMKEPAMRKAFHNMSLLLRELERTYCIDGAQTKAPDKVPAKPASASAEITQEIIVKNAQALETLQQVRIFTDGASKGNPGPSGIAYVFLGAESAPVYEHCECIGVATNNEAEYRALIAALGKALELGKRKVAVFSDSELVVNQVLGRWKINKPELAVLQREALALRRQFESFTISAVPRASNKRADFLATLCLTMARQAGVDLSEGETGE